MADAPAFVYLHGFASGPASAKARFFRDLLAARGVELHLPDLNEGEGGFTGLTISRSIRQVRALVDSLGRDVVLVGSSLGGYTAALVSNQDPRVRAAVLLAPAFDLTGRWVERFGREGIDRWRAAREIEVDHHARGRKERIGFGLYLDAMGHAPFPRTGCPTLVLHGIRDAEVDVDGSRKYAELTPEARLVELPTDHGMLDALGRIGEEAELFLEPWLPPRRA